MKIIGLGAAAMIGLGALTAAIPARSACSLGWCSEDENSPSYKQWLRTNREELDRRERAERASKARALEEDRRSANAPQESMLYQMISRQPDRHVGEIIGFSGRVAQSFNTESSYVLRVEVARGAYQTWKDAVYVEYAGIPPRSVADGDMVQFRGRFIGIKSYQAILGNTIHIPAVAACQIVSGGVSFARVDAQCEDGAPTEEPIAAPAPEKVAEHAIEAAPQPKPLPKPAAAPKHKSSAGGFDPGRLFNH